MRPIVVFFTGVMLLAAGCIRPPVPTRDPHEVGTYVVTLPSHIEPANLTVETYYLVAVTGGENWERMSGDSNDPVFRCPSSPNFTFHNATKTASYSGSRYTFNEQNLKILVLWDYERVEVSEDGLRLGCSNTHKLAYGYGNLETKAKLRPDFTVNLSIQAVDGFIRFNRDHYIPIGTKVHVNLTRIEDSARATYFVSSDFEVVNLGAWDKENLTRTR